VRMRWPQTTPGRLQSLSLVSCVPLQRTTVNSMLVPLDKVAPMNNSYGGCDFRNVDSTSGGNRGQTTFGHDFMNKNYQQSLYCYRAAH
jgi:hypothetical protein